MNEKILTKKSEACAGTCPEGRFFRILSEVAWWHVSTVFVFSTVFFSTSYSAALVSTAFYLVLARFAWQKIVPAWNGSWTENLFQKSDDAVSASKFDFKIAGAFFAVFFVVIIIGGALHFDMAGQWNQVLTGEYDDWHPLTHTFFIWLTTIVWRTPKFFFVVQAAIFAGTLAGVFCVLQNYCRFKKKIAIGIVAVAALHPAILESLRFATKDTAMMVAFVAVTICVGGIVMTRGAWLRSPVVFIAFVVAVFAGSTFRHNGIFFTIPLLATLPFCIEKKYWTRFFAVVVCIVVVFAGTKIYIEKNFSSRAQNQKEQCVSQTYIETIGVPFGILVNVAKNNPEKLSAEAWKFLDEVAPRERWQYYRLGDANTCLKWDKEISANLRHALVKLSPADFLKLVGETVVAAPKEASRAFFGHVFFTWQLNRWPGAWVAILLFTGILAFPILKWEVLPLTLPTFFYQAGTSLLMYGTTDMRFYYYTIPVCLVFSALIVARCMQKRGAKEAIVVEKN